MSNSGSSGKMPNKKNKETIPYELRNAREWDPNYRKEDHSSDDDSDDGDDFNSDEDYDYDYDCCVPYVSGGPEANGTAANKISNTANLSDGFQQVSYKHSSKNPPSPNGSGLNGRMANQHREHRARPKSIFNYKRDNLARAAFRKRQTPSGKYTLRKLCHEIEPNQAKMYNLIEEIGVRLGSFVRPPQHLHDRDLLIWGNAAQVRKTIAELHDHFGRSQDMIRKSTAKDKFVSEHSTIGYNYKSMQKKMEKEALIQRFQQVPEASHTYPYTGSFLWPVDEVRPEELFGSSLEAFDPVRFQYKCHIVFDNKLSVFEVLTNNSESVKKALRRIEGTMKEFIAKNHHRRSVEYLVEPPSPPAIKQDVKTLPGPSLSRIPTLIGKIIDSKAGERYLEQSTEMKVKNSHRLEQALCKTIPNLPYYRGQLQMRIYFGTFALSQFRWPGTASSISFEQFMENMALSNTKGDIIKDLQIKRDAATIMSKIYEAKNIFLPVSNSIDKLIEVAPSFAARFTFQELNKPTMLLDIEMNITSLDNIYERMQALWTRADRRDNITLLDVFMAQLDGGSSCKLHISNEHTIDASRITPKMRDFVNSVNLKIPPKTKPEITGHKVFQWKKGLPGTMHPTSFEQKASFKYRLVRNTDWMFEIARYDTFGDPKDEKVPVYTHWAATLWNTNWDSILTANAGLDIGQSATWDPKLATFFPRPAREAPYDQGVDPGVLDFLDIVRTITNFLDGLNKELPHLRR